VTGAATTEFQSSRAKTKISMNSMDGAVLGRFPSLQDNHMLCSARMSQTVVASILHGAYGDLYEQAICLKHFAVTHPEVRLKLFAATASRLDSFRAFDLSFASVFELWTEIASHPDIESFFQFQVHDRELNENVLQHLSDEVLAKIDRVHNQLPWTYLRDNHLIPVPKRFELTLSAHGQRELSSMISSYDCLDEKSQTISFLWRYRARSGAIRGIGQPPKQTLV
jgi:hypothetical protein